MARRPVCVLGLLGAIASCHSQSDTEKQQLLEQIQRAEETMAKVAWGEAPSPEQHEQTALRFACVWQGLEQRGLDPRPDLRCLARMKVAGAACYEKHNSHEPCLNVMSDQGCELSPDAIAVANSTSCRGKPTTHTVDHTVDQQRQGP